VKEGIIGADVPFPDAVALSEEIAQLRYSLTPEEIERYGGSGKGRPWLWKKLYRRPEREKRNLKWSAALPGALEGPH